MDDLLQDLIAYAIEKKASDIHFVVQNQKLQIKLRTQNDMLDVYQDIWQPAFFEYLKFISRMDLTSPYVPQSGQFKILLHNHEIFCRFSMLNNHNVQTGVIRMLNTMHAIELNALSLWKEDTHFFNSLVPLRQGLVISVGPTNSGKTTTLHALFAFFMILVCASLILNGIYTLYFQRNLKIDEKIEKKWFYSD